MADPIKLPNGKWRTRTRYKDPITNNWREKTFTAPTKKAVKEKEYDFLAKVSEGEVVKEIKLLDFYDTWSETFKKGKVTEGRMQKIRVTRKNLADFFGDNQTLRGVSKLKYQQWINWLATPGNVNERGLALETVTNRHNIVKSMFIEALDMRYVHSNPTKNIRLDGQKPLHKSKKTVSTDETKKLLSHLLQKEDSASKYFVLTQIYTGCRYQEIAALKWKDINYEDETIMINKAFKYDASIKRFGSTKSEAGNRNVDVPTFLLDELKKYKIKQNEAMLSGRLINPRHLIFCNDKDTWPISNSAVNKYLKDLCLSVGIPQLSTHSFRHGRIDSLILAETDLVYILSQIGHKEITQSIEYASATLENRIKNRKKTNEYLKDLIPESHKNTTKDIL
ncbi:tyrosine-type recombinase/integrase [Enterococcus alishanensis]